MGRNEVPLSRTINATYPKFDFPDKNRLWGKYPG